MSGKKLEFENLRDLIGISAPVLAPDGARIVYARGISDYATGKIRTQLIEKNLQTGETEALPDERWIQKDTENEYFIACREGRSNVFCRDGEEAYPITDADCILDFAGPVHGKLLLLKSEWNRPAYLTIAELQTDTNGHEKAARETVVVDENQWLDEYTLTRPEPLSVEVRDQKVRIHGWVMLPNNDQTPDTSGSKDGKTSGTAESEDGKTLGTAESENEKTSDIAESEYGQTSDAAVSENRQASQSTIPAVLYLHDDSDAWSVNGFFYEAQMLSACGMAVIFFAPKGSAGCVSDACGTEFRKDADARETKFRKGIDAYGPEVIDEIQSFLKEALKRYPQIDANRIGVTGSGYAGFLTHRLISETNDFAAAVVQRAWVNPASSYGLGDMEFYREELEEKTFQEFMENRVRKSILKNIRKVQIPVLLLHGEADQICALEQSEQVYHLLRSMHPELPVRIVIFPGEGHDLLQNGLMHNRIRHMQELVAWFETYLSGEGWKREV